MIFRKAVSSDIDKIARIYGEIHDEEEAGRATTGWKRAIYPTRETAERSVADGEMFVCEVDGAVAAAARINQVCEEAYDKAAWSVKAPPEKIMVLHTLVVSPCMKGRGIGTAFVAFYEQYARENGCPYLRMDTNERNAAARSLYSGLGYAEISIVDCDFHGLESIRLVCLEKTLG